MFAYFRVEGVDYVLFVSSVAMKCFSWRDASLKCARSEPLPVAPTEDPGQVGAAPRGSGKWRSELKTQPMAVKPHAAPHGFPWV